MKAQLHTWTSANLWKGDVDLRRLRRRWHALSGRRDKIVAVEVNAWGDETYFFADEQIVRVWTHSVSTYSFHSMRVDR